MILALQTTTFSAYGGIPTYNKLVCRVLNEDVSSEKHRVLIAMDAARDAEAAAPRFENLELRAFGGSRLRLTLTFLRLALSKNIEVLLIGHVHYAPLGWILKRFRPRVTYGVFLYGIDAWQQLQGIRLRALQAADFMISISEYTKDNAVRINALDTRKIHLLSNADEQIDDGLLNEQNGHSRLDIRLLTVCRLEESERYKGVDHVIEVLAALAETVPSVSYVIVGGGSDLERHKRLAEKLGVTNRVHFRGLVSDETLQRYYSDCDVFVMPSAAEGFGFVFLEAMRHRKPIIAADSGGAPEVVVNDVSGRLVEYGNKSQLLEALTDLSLNKEKRERMGAAGYQRLQEKFTYSHFKETLSNILLQERKASTALRQLAPSVEEHRQA